ncbi:hypothetical protein [Glycomyces tritici]|uniref:Integral membrane protein n=1 Tax=Glycomyces tritici TaxID=2665176 RepID=A0ABT7YRJ6_9ACTN|nr:hypothetical protein [Glycomyces tritici]MDN3241271.1 hypothetical protein [Glycomyces tritici]MDN3243294.1 hypothetical protein [Glycomyces tritici]
MIEWLYLAVQAAALLMSAWFFVDTARSQLVGRRHLVGVAALEVLLLAQLAVSIAIVPGEAGDGKALFFSYLVTTILVPVAACFWGSIDRSRWGIGTVAASGLICAALMLRVHQIWELQVNV